MSPHLSAEDRAFADRALEASIRIGLVALLFGWCFQVARPFVQPVIWAIILAVATHPAYVRLDRALGGRKRLAAGLLVASALLLLIVPAVSLSSNLVDSATWLARKLSDGKLAVPPPPASVADWPIVGNEVFGVWSTASNSLEAALRPLAPQLKVVGEWILSTGATAGFGIVMFVLSIVIAGALLSVGDAAGGAARHIAQRLAPERGDELVELARATVQSVTRGILGVALIQGTLAGIGMLAVGVPAASLWAFLVMFSAIVQLPTLVVLGPVAVYVFTASPTWVAVLFAIWTLVVGLSDNVLKPLLLGRGVNVPTLVIFIGSIGGFMLNGILGLFIGAVVLALGYTLFRAWLEVEQAEPAEASPDPTPGAGPG